MLSSLLVAALLAQAPDCSADAGYQPVVLDAHHADVWLRNLDGGTSDAPLRLNDVTVLDARTTVCLAKGKADCRGQESVGPEIDTQTLLWTGGIMFTVGLLAGGLVVGLWKR